MQHLDLFSGIGGFALAARMVGGINTIQFCEINPYCQKVLQKNFSGVPIHDDITTFTAEPGQYDLITGGFPCQDISSANPNGRGLEGKRSGLFYELMRIVCECRPRYIVLENVAAMLSKYNGRVMGSVLWALSESGYDAEWQTISAASVGAPHLRERVFIVAYSKHNGLATKQKGHQRVEQQQRWAEGSKSSVQLKGSSERPFLQREVLGTLSDPNGAGLEARIGSASTTQAIGKLERSGLLYGECKQWATEPGVLRVVNGIPSRVDRIRGLGNAVVPQVASIPLQRVLSISGSDR